MKIQERIGCESYLYKDIQCCINTCSASECPEPICAIEFPGGINSYIRYKELQRLLRSGLDIKDAAEQLGISMQIARITFNKGNKVLGWLSLT